MPRLQTRRRVVRGGGRKTLGQARIAIVLGALILTSVAAMLWLGSGVGVVDTKVYLRGKSVPDHVWVHLDAQPFVSWLSRAFGGTKNKS